MCQKIKMAEPWIKMAFGKENQKITDDTLWAEAFGNEKFQRCGAASKRIGLRY
jgi:hypothetical protein